MSSCQALPTWVMRDTATYEHTPPPSHAPLSPPLRRWLASTAPPRWHLSSLSASLRLSLLDLHLSYFVHRERNSLKGWHAELLRRCGTTRIGVGNGAEAGGGAAD